MQNTANINVRVDSGLKSQAEMIFNELGLNLSSAITVFLRNAVRFGGIPFDLRLETPNAVTLQAMQDVSQRKGLHGPFDSLEALMEDLNAED